MIISFIVVDFVKADRRVSKYSWESTNYIPDSHSAFKSFSRVNKFLKKSLCM